MRSEETIRKMIDEYTGELKNADIVGEHLRSIQEKT